MTYETEFSGNVGKYFKVLTANIYFRLANN